jgi:GDP-L-fucose synthase
LAVYGNRSGNNSEDAALLFSDLSGGELNYGAAKRHQEDLFSEICVRNGIDYSIVRIPSLYGPFSTLNLHNAHVIPAFIIQYLKKESGIISAYGTGNEQKEFLFSYDLAKIYQLLIDNHVGIINVSNGAFVKIKDLTETIKMCDHRNVNFEFTKPSLTDIDVRKVENKKFHKIFPNFNFTELYSGMKQTVDWYQTNWSNK